MLGALSSACCRLIMVLRDLKLLGKHEKEVGGVIRDSAETMASASSGEVEESDLEQLRETIQGSGTRLRLQSPNICVFAAIVEAGAT